MLKNGIMFSKEFPKIIRKENVCVYTVYTGHFCLTTTVGISSSVVSDTK